MKTDNKPRIHIEKARQHNLKNISLDIPRDELVVVCGPSGSGKSTLAFDIVYAEGQRRYVESLSAYARQFLPQMDKPDVEKIEGLSPAISLEQQSVSRNPRSTVGTVTEIHDFLRVFFARLGRMYCPQCGRPIEARAADEIIGDILALPQGTKFMVLAPLVELQKGTHLDKFKKLKAEGFAQGARGRRVLHPGRRARPGQEQEAQHRSGGGPPGEQGGHPGSAGRLCGTGPALRRRSSRVARTGQARGRTRHRPFHYLGLPALSYFPARAQPAAFFLQRPAGGLPALRGPGQRGLFRAAPHRAQPGPFAEYRRAAALGHGQDVQPLRNGAQGSGQTFQVHIIHAFGSVFGRGSGRPCSTARTSTASPPPAPWACAATGWAAMWPWARRAITRASISRRPSKPRARWP